jgi:hypothetical protein
MRNEWFPVKYQRSLSNNGHSFNAEGCLLSREIHLYKVYYFIILSHIK